MKRIAFLVSAIVLCALAGAGASLVAAQAPTAAPAAPAAHPLIGLHGGKIIAIKPPGNWAQGGGAAGTGPAASLRAPLALPVFGTDVLVASSNETFIASNPLNPLQFIAGSNAVARSFSSNGGVSWTTTSPSGIGDPAGVYDNAGNAYFAQLSTGTCPDPAVVSRSANGGATWGSQVTALSDASPTDHFIDKEWITADTAAGSPFAGRIYVTASSFHTPAGCNLNAYIDNREVIASSTNQGATWSTPATLSDASHNQDQFTNPIVASDGTLYVSYQYQNCTFNCTSSIPMVQLLTKSTDGGVTFSPSMTITGAPMVPTGAFSGGYQYLYANSTTAGFRHNDQAIIGVSPTNPQHVYAVWTDGRFESSFVYSGITGQHADIVFSRSTDGGTTWSPVTKINDDNVQGKDQFFPWMTVGTDGTIHASWMDRREAAVNGFPYREYYSQSTDEGLTWSVNQPVGDVPNTPSTFIGDYSGLAVNANNSRVLPIWTDQRSGQSVYTDPGLIPVQGTPTTTPTGGVPSATRTATVVSGGTATPTVCAGGPGTWTDLAHVPVNKGRAVGVTMNSAIYVFGGRPDNTVFTQDVYRYDLAGNTWSLLAQQLPDALTSNMAGGLLTFPEGQRAFIVGGSGTGSVVTGRTLAFNPADGSFTAKAAWPASPVHLPGGWAVMNNKFYVFGGYNPNVGMTADIWAYDPMTDAWTQSAAVLSLARGYIATEAMPDGLIYLGGGSQYNGGNLTDETIFEKFNPATNTIALGPVMPVALSNDHGYNVSGQFVVVAGGFTTSVTTVLAYNPGSNTWATALNALFPVRNYAKGYGLNGSIYAIGGTADAAAATYYPYNQMFTPAPPCGTATPTVVATVTVAPPSATSTSVAPSATRTTVAATVTVAPPSATSTSVAPSATRTTVAATATNTGGPTASSTPAATATACTISFTDVHPADYFYVPVLYLACHGVVSGYNDGTFRPYNNTTRSQMVKIVVLGFNKPISTPAGGAFTFTDVPPTFPFFSVIETAAALNIVSGYTCGQAPAGPCDAQHRPWFLPYANVTRGQLAKIDVVAAGWALLNPASRTFQDVLPGTAFYEFVETAAARGVISGYACGGPGEPCGTPPRPYFRQYNDAIRGQIAKIVYLSILSGPSGSSASK